MKKLHADPEWSARNRERARAHMKSLHARPDFAAKCGHLTPFQLAAIAQQIATTKKTYIEIGLDWLITGNHVGQIAKRFGVQRNRKRKVN
ncbi:MAG TPA: hypothetical protein VG501_10125 [Rhizomicrobium sp.]|nr:hypothetical protein [Rhizomicrobium sp.]